MSDLQEDISRDSTDDLRQKILDTAEELFSKKGFRGTSVRDITVRANCLF